MDIKELKAHAFDLIAAIQRLQLELQNTNAKIVELEQSNAARNNNNDTN